MELSRVCKRLIVMMVIEITFTLWMGVLAITSPNVWWFMAFAGLCVLNGHGFRSSWKLYKTTKILAELEDEENNDV